MKGKVLILMTLLWILPIMVKAGEIKFENPVKVSNNIYTIDVKIENMDLNYINGKLILPNGRINSITMASGWKNKNNTSNNFYFYRDGIVSGTYKVATIEISITESGNYSVDNLKFGVHKCVNENNLYFGETGRIVTKNTYDNTCGLSNDATLKSLTPSTGSLTPSFEKEKETYHLSVKKEVSSVKFNAIPNHKKAKVIKGNTCALNDGFNTCEIIVESERKTTKKYIVYVYRAPGSNEAFPYDTNITNFQVHNGTLEKAFNQNTYEYNIKVNKEAEKIYFTFLTDGGKVSHTSDTCNAYADSCTLTITLQNSLKRVYTFYLINEDTVRPNPLPTPSEPVKDPSKPTTVKPETPSKTDKDNKNNNDKNESSNEKKDTNTSISDMPNKNTPNNKEENKNNTSSTTVEEENSKKEELKTSEKKETITIPLLKKEISKKIVFSLGALLIFLIGFLIGRALNKRKRKNI